MVFKHVVRAGAVALGTVLSVCALAVPAAAEDVVPSGCVGTIYYACTGDAQPPMGWLYPVEHVEVPVTFTTPGVPLVPGVSVGGQPIGGVIVPVGGQTVPGRTVTVGPVPPTDTGIVTPTHICAFVTCIPAGTPVVVPGVPLPVAPVNIPTISVPSETVGVPVVGTVPVTETPAIGVPAFDESVTTLRVYESPQDWFSLAYTTCGLGGGEVDADYTGTGLRWDYYCTGGLLTVPADYFFERAGY